MDIPNNIGWSKTIELLYDNTKLADVYFLFTNNQRIPAHKIILSLKSPTFYAMFFGKKAETKETNPTEIEINDLSYSAFSAMLHYIYFDTADKINVDNVIELRNAAKTYQLNALESFCHQHIEKHVETVINMEKFDAETLKSMVLDDNLTMKEVHIFNMVVKWSERQCELQQLRPTRDNKRKILGDKIISSIRYGLMSAEEIATHVDPSDLLSSDQLRDIYRSLALKNPKEMKYISKPRAFREAGEFTDSVLLSSAHKSILTEWYDSKCPSNWRLKYRASRDGFDSKAFHGKCDSIVNGSYVVIRSSNGSLFGGYTPCIWVGNGVYHTDARSFIFSLFRPHNTDNASTPYKFENVERSIYCHPVHGPTFGSGHDFYIASGSNQNVESYSNMGLGYRTPQSIVYSSPQAKSYLVGTYNFQTNEIEVFEKIN